MGKNWNQEGVQVIISTHNNAATLLRCLASVEHACKDHRWALFVADDGSSDDTYEMLEKYKATSEGIVSVKKFGKAINVSQAKNRAVEMGVDFRVDYPAIVLMDADDIMAEDRVTKLLNALRNNDEYLAAVGDHMRIGDEYLDHMKVYRAVKNMHYLGHFGPWATVFHESLIPEDGKLFDEEVFRAEDNVLYMKWLANGVKMITCPGVMTHYYHRKSGSAFNTKDKEDEKETTQKWSDIKFELFFKKDIELGHHTDVTFYCILPDVSTVDLGSFGSIYKNLNWVSEYPNINFVYLDQTKNGVWLSMMKFPFVKEIACNVMRVAHVHKLSESEISSRVFELSTGEVICFLKPNYELKDHDIDLAIAAKAKTENITSRKNTISMKRDFFKESFYDSPSK
jgi:glycosyltransferase involved in cell wall biosynthesis